MEPAMSTAVTTRSVQWRAYCQDDSIHSKSKLTTRPGYVMSCQSGCFSSTQTSRKAYTIVYVEKEFKKTVERVQNIQKKYNDHVLQNNSSSQWWRPTEQQLVSMITSHRTTARLSASFVLLPFSTVYAASGMSLYSICVMQCSHLWNGLQCRQHFDWQLSHLAVLRPFK